jgi:DNA-binding IclR family transcriptional regulator
VGDLVPLTRGTGGRVLMAFSGAKGAMYERIRQDGYVALIGDRSPELAGISAPVFKAQGELVAAVTLTMPANRFRQEHIEPTRQAARAISGKLGYTGA